MKFGQKIKRMICAALAAGMLMNVCACGSGMSKSTVNLMSGIRASSKNESVEPSDDFVGSYADFAINLFRQSAVDEKNAAISPLSVMLALAMTANGAEGETLAQMQNALGGMDIEDLNKYLSSYVKNLPSSDKSKITLANSIWLRDDKNRLNVNDDFLKANANYYSADAYSAPFDSDTLNDINNWVSENTDGRIKEMLNEISVDAVMYLINALTFDAEWLEPYVEDNVVEEEFNGANGKQTVDMMYSGESKYIDDGKATGFVKPYADGYSFVALLPNEGVSIGEYIASMSGEKFVESVKSAKSCTVSTAMPKFTTEYSVELSDALKAMGMTSAFDDKADFSGIDSQNELFISQVMHKTYISVNERGTKAGAATAVEMRDGAVLEEIKYVMLNRPFVYAIIDNETNLPIFIGTVMNVE